MQSINAKYEEILNGGCDYANYYLMLKYALDNYSKEYVNKLINNHDFLYEEKPNLYKEVMNNFKDHKEKQK